MTTTITHVTTDGGILFAWASSDATDGRWRQIKTKLPRAFETASGGVAHRMMYDALVTHFRGEDLIFEGDRLEQMRDWHAEERAAARRSQVSA